MYWRKDPMKGKNSFAGPPDWPRNGALLKGVVHELPSKPENSLKWLEGESINILLRSSTNKIT
jgi:hypothetical protein